MAFGKSHRDPYATSVGHLIEKATFAGVQTEDWGQFMHICDIINTVQDGPKDAVKALKKRISKNYNHKEIQLTLSLIDMCLQNCGPSFQSLIVKKEFVKDCLVKLLNPRYTLPLDIQNKILNFIKTWSQGFSGGVDVSEVKEVYLDLVKKGVQFPSSDAEAETTPPQTAEISSNPPTSVPTAPALSSIVAPKSSTIMLVPEQIGKLHSELDMVKMNVRVMSTILMENTPGSENYEDIELLQKLYKTSREMQERIMDLLVVVENEDVTVELIQVNEDLNNALLGYERTPWTKIKVLAGLHSFLETLRENPFPCLLQFLAVPCFLWLMPPIFKASDNWLSPHTVSLLLPLLLPSSPFKDLCDYFGPTFAIQDNLPVTTSEPSAPSCDLLDLSPSPPTPRATLGELSTMNAQLSDLSFRSPSPVMKNNVNPSRHPQADLLASENTETPLFPQRTSQNLASSHIYDNFPEDSHSVLLQPVNLQSIPATSSNQRLPSLPSGHPAMIKNDLQQPSYYEIMEFDPLAPAVTAEAVYEEIDDHQLRRAQSHIDC
ncbi:TOM1-like protein 1 [Trichechus manatus latirostris]|uniref:TOM1-like protein 1 n=1 Tax=Trichechus manatus latirostris TaxID=127582 RepID=A0A2Y9DQ60_TRIMA|nr:TOM1-like protein 1 [Trichechus manatus latirostris]